MAGKGCDKATCSLLRTRLAQLGLLQIALPDIGSPPGPRERLGRGPGQPESQSVCLLGDGAQLEQLLGVTAALQQQCRKDIDAVQSVGDLLPLLPAEALPQLFGGLVVALAFEKRGCRLLQVVLERCDGPGRRHLAAELCGHVCEALESPHANHVLQRLVELLPPGAVRFVLDEMQSWPGRSSADIASHKFGCRIVERLLEHFTADAAADRAALSASSNAASPELR